MAFFSSILICSFYENVLVKSFHGVSQKSVGERRAFVQIGSPLPATGNAIDFWALYANRIGWREIASSAPGVVSINQRGLPQPGDIMVWAHAPYGHVAIVTAVTPPQRTHAGSVTFAESNGPGAIISEPLLPDLTVQTWPGYTVYGYIRATSSTTASNSLTTSQIPNSPYVAVARQDATTAGIDPQIFVRQINVESGFNPNAVSPKGAIGIAQFMPGTAVGLGIDPHDPVASLKAAANLMASYLTTYKGDYAMALAAYNAGPGAVQSAINAAAQGGHSWTYYLPTETQGYISTILGT